MWLLVTALLVLCNCSVKGKEEIEILKIENEIKAGKHFHRLLQFVFDPKALRDLNPWMIKNKYITWIDEADQYFKDFNAVYERKLTPKGLPYDIYNPIMVEEAKTFTHLLIASDFEPFQMTLAWGRQNINEGIFLYSVRAALLYQLPHFKISSPNILNPYNFYNGEAFRQIDKLYMQYSISNSIDQDDYEANNITVEAKYSGWNINDNACDKVMNYFREDPELNCYNLGLHLLHPFWMSDKDLNDFNPEHAELYYHYHHQLLSRYKLERMSNNLGGIEELTEDCLYSDYIPYLDYQNGNSYPIRKNLANDKIKEKLQPIYETSQSIYNVLSEKILYLPEGKSVNITKPEDLHHLVTLVRKYLDNLHIGRRICKILSDENDELQSLTPSLLNHPETSLRDPIYWKLLNKVLNIFYTFKSSLSPRKCIDLSDSSIVITGVKVNIGPTKFVEYSDDVRNAYPVNDFFGPHIESNKISITQKRIYSNNVTINFDVTVEENMESVVRIFIGPKSFDWKAMIELDVFKIQLFQGVNEVVWSPQNMSASFDDIYKFPKRMLLPKGNTNGFPIKVFILVTRNNSTKQELDYPLVEPRYYEITKKVDDKPAGFPFDLPLDLNQHMRYSNFKFVPAYIFHSS